MRCVAIALVLAGLALSPVHSRGGAAPEVDQTLIDALLVIAANPDIDTAQLINIVEGVFPGYEIHEILDLLWPPLAEDAATDPAQVPSYALSTGFEDTWPLATGFEDTPGPAFDLTDHTAPAFETTVLMAVLSEAARRITILEESDRLAEVYRAAGGIELPRPFRISPLGLRWYAAVEARDYEAMAEIAGRIRARRERFPRTSAQGLR